MHYNNLIYPKIGSLLTKTIKNLIIFASLFLLFNVVLAFSPVLVLEWSNPINSLPRHLAFFDVENDRLPEIAVAANPNRVILYSNTGNSVLWSFQSSYPISKLAVLHHDRETNPLLMVAASPYLYALNGSGKISWQLFLPDIIGQAVTWLEMGNFGPGSGEEIMVIADNLIFFIEPDSKSITKFRLPFLPDQVEISNLNADEYNEVLLSNFDKLISVKAQTGIELDFSLNNLNYEINRGFDIYGFNPDRTAEIIAITKQGTDSTPNELKSYVTCLTSDGKVLWQSSLGNTIPRAIKVFRGEILIVGTGPSGQDNILKMDRSGKIIKNSYLIKEDSPKILYSPAAKFNTNSINLQNFFLLGNFLLGTLGENSEGEMKIMSLKLFSSNLDEINLSSSDYFSNLNVVTSDRTQKILSVYLSSINGDTLDDLIVLREDRGKGFAIDCYINRMDILARAETEMLNSYRAALASNNQTVANRYKYRAEILAANLGNLTYALRTENSMRREWNNRTRFIILRTLLITIVLVLIVGGLGVVLVRPIIKRIVWRKAQVEEKSVPTVVKIATELIALNHNYIVKGNRTGAYRRLIEIINKYDLNADQDLGSVVGRQFSSATALMQPRQEDFLLPYNRFIQRLNKETRIINLASIIKKICNNVLAEDTPIQEFSVNRNDYKTNHAIEIARSSESNLAVSFFYLVNVDFPDIYQHSKFFWDSRLYNWFEHVCTDHLRYAKRYAHFVFDYETATEWNRKLVIHLVSDSERNINFDRKDSHLVSEFEDIKSIYQDYIVMTDQQQMLYYPGEKIWIKIFDLLSILSSIIGIK